MSNDNNLAMIFQSAVARLPFYRKLLMDKNISAESVIDNKSFVSLVPVISKEEVFGQFSLIEMSPYGLVPEYQSAIVSSGTSGIFSFGLITRSDIEKQRAMVDFMMESLFSAGENPPLIINSLPMGVSFTSSYPVISTSTRTDIALKVIQMLGSDRQVVIVTDPNILKRILEEGVQLGIDWSKYRVSPIIGGSWFSDSCVQYLQEILNGRETDPLHIKNRISSTMGVTEVALNIFAATPDLIEARHELQMQASAARAKNGDSYAVPILFYAMSPNVYLEIADPDDSGFGDLVVTHLDEGVLPQLIRYKTGDRVKSINRNELEKMGIQLSLPHPIFAVAGRSSDMKGMGLNPYEVKQLLYIDETIASSITGHFEIIYSSHDLTRIRAQLLPGVSGPKTDTLPATLEVEFVEYFRYTRGLTLSYEHKWKHLS